MNKKNVKKALHEAQLTFVTAVGLAPHIGRDFYRKARVYRRLLKSDYKQGSTYYGREYRARRALRCAGVHRACDLSMDNYMKIRDKVIPNG